MDRRDLREGDEGDDVRELQVQLGRLSIYAGSVDGRFGPRMTDVIRNFQKDEGLQPDGVVGAATRARLLALETLAIAGVDTPRPLAWTSSVQAIAALAQPVTALDVAQQLWQEHESYPARREALDLLARFQPAQVTRTGLEWVKAVDALVDRQAIEAIPDAGERVLHGKLLLYGLAAIEEQLRGALDEAGIMSALRRAITPDPETLLLHSGSEHAAPGPGGSPPRSPDAKLVADAPATIDLLDRDGFAIALSELLRKQRTLTGFGEGMLLIQLFGAWGSGKTSVAGFVRKALERPNEVIADADADAQEPWLFVTFDAWKHQRTAPPWWWLMDAVYRRGRLHRRWIRDSVWRHSPSRYEGSPADLGAWRRTRLVAWRWGWGVVGIIAAIGLILAAAAFRLVSIDEVSKAKEAITAVLGLLSAIGAVYALYRGGRAASLVGSPRAANALVRSGGDPLRRIHDRYAKLIALIKRPVLVFIDNLDRCQPTYLVELLEGIQTIFADVQVTYLVAADREWVAQCFEQEYAALSGVMGRPGRPLGYLFLEKTFSLSAALPIPSVQARQRYWDAVLRQGEINHQVVTPAARAKAKERVANQTVASVFAEVQRLDPADVSAGARALREAAAVKVVDATIDGEQDHELAPYLALMEDNPRSLKRLRNAVSLARAGRLTGGEVLTKASDLDGLIRWTIVTLRWPALAVALSERPDLAAPLVDGIGDGLGAGLQAAADDEALHRLLTLPVAGQKPDLPAWLADQYGPAQPLKPAALA